MTKIISRREIVSFALFTGLTARVLADAPPAKVNEKDSVAVALGYVSDAKHVDTKASPQYKAGSTCSSCSWYQGKPGDAAGGACTFFPGKNVDANGWCRMYNKKQ
jgi:High potential iron-sulfur protein